MNISNQEDQAYEKNTNEKDQHKQHWEENKEEEDVKDDIKSISNESTMKLMIGVIVGAGVVIVVLLCMFFGYRLFARKRVNSSKKYSYHPPGPGHNLNMTPEVTLTPINSVQAPQRQINAYLHNPGLHVHSQLNRFQISHNSNNNRQQFLHPDFRSPPPYNESFLDNGGSVVAV